MLIAVTFERWNYRWLLLFFLLLMMFSNFLQESSITFKHTHTQTIHFFLSKQNSSWCSGQYVLPCYCPTIPFTPHGRYIWKPMWGVGSSIIGWGKSWDQSATNHLKQISGFPFVHFCNEKSEIALDFNSSINFAGRGNCVEKMLES